MASVPDVESRPKDLFPNLDVVLSGREVRGLPGLPRHIDDVQALFLGNSCRHVVLAGHWVDDNHGMRECAQGPGVLGKRDAVLQARLREVEQKAPKASFNRTAAPLKIE